MNSTSYDSFDKEIEQDVITVANRLIAVFEAISDAVLVYDLRGTILHINPAAIYLFGCKSAKDAIGQKCFQLMDRYQVYDENGKQLQAQQMWMSHIKDDESCGNEQHQAQDIMIRFPSGCECQLNIAGSPIHDQKGKIIGGVCVFRDVTEQRQKSRQAMETLASLLVVAEELVRFPERIDKLSDTFSISLPSIGSAAQRLAEILHQVLESNTVGISSLTPSQHLNLIGISGLPEEEIAAARAEVDKSTLADYFEDKDISDLYTNTVILRNLVQHPFEQRSAFGMSNLLVAPMMIGTQLIGIFFIDRAEDRPYTQEEIAVVKAIAKLNALVIERVRLLGEWAQTRSNEIALEETNRRFDTFLSIASHELRTPLTGIRGNVQLALRRIEKIKACATDIAKTTLLKEGERIQQPLEETVRRAISLDRMIGDLLDASRIRANNFVVSMKPCDLKEIVRTTVEDLQEVITDRQISLYLPEESQVPISGDADRIQQVTHNYIVNALKYSPPEKPVDVYLEVKDDQACVEVRDEGPGLSIEEQKHIWERFYRAKGIEVQYGSGAGLGLGLYLCSTIIERHHGQVGLISKQHEGSTFWFTLPLASHPLP
ncbi:sensor histidine kinase [Dictyobacter kobayashii]|uniref:histidine kinase n=1 Tax=Dictyobacter kobayashii TaxID=2014872 RepID=A0A402AUT8_9CHLR|nr:ATP-binding protein [Dictyobacter kobayashii]GCE22857.1 hypothetical protein KDK_66570 [Dictyobacter kobayashii]